MHFVNKLVFNITIIILLISFSSSIVLAGELEIIDFSTNQQLTNFQVYIEDINNNFKFYKYVSNSPIFIPSDTGKVKVMIGNNETEGDIDYYGEGDIEDKQIYVVPIGKLDIVVLDQLENRIPNASLSIRCNKVIPFDIPRNVNRFGELSLFLPATNCEIIVKDKYIMSESVEIVHGDIRKIEIIIQDEKEFPVWIPILLLLIILSVFGLYYLIKKRQKTILSTLNSMDRSIVELVMKEKKVSQADVRKILKIPKATLSRHVSDLVSKNILITNSIGKKVEITLNPWFNSGSKKSKSSES